jgi:hypothetical protein
MSQMADETPQWILERPPQGGLSCVCAWRADEVIE